MSRGIYTLVSMKLILNSSELDADCGSVRGTVLGGDTSGGAAKSTPLSGESGEVGDVAERFALPCDLRGGGGDGPCCCISIACD